MSALAVAAETERRTIEELNRQYLRAGEHGDVDWYGEHLADDFLSSAVDGSISDKAAFLKRIARGRAGSGFQAHDVRIRFVGELAPVGRYTDIYAQRGSHWRCVSAHFNYF